jgi:hypothetical protein
MSDRSPGDQINSHSLAGTINLHLDTSELIPYRFPKLWRPRRSFREAIAFVYKSCHQFPAFN